MERLKEIGRHPSVRLAMKIANTEACRSGSRYIEPVHLLLATLNIVDDCYDQNGESHDLTPEDFLRVREVSASCRTLLRISDAQITSVRRRLDEILTERNESVPVYRLEFSPESLYLIQKAARRAFRSGSQELNLVELFEELLNDLPKEVTPLLRS